MTTFVFFAKDDNGLVYCVASIADDQEQALLCAKLMYPDLHSFDCRLSLSASCLAFTVDYVFTQK